MLRARAGEAERATTPAAARETACKAREMLQRRE